MFGNFLKKVFGTKSKRDVKRMLPLVAKINALEVSYQSLTDDELEELIDRKNELKSYASELDDVNDKIKSKIGERERVLTGKYLVERKSCERKPYTVQGGTYYKLNIKKIG